MMMTRFESAMYFVLYVMFTAALVAAASVAKSANAAPGDAAVVQRANDQTSTIEVLTRAARVKSLVSQFLLEQETQRQAKISGAALDLAGRNSFSVNRAANLAGGHDGGGVVLDDRDCRPGNGGTACMDVVCAKLGTFGCDDRSEITAVLNLCRGNYNGDCVSAVCDHLGTFGCDDLSEVQQVAQACQRNFDGGCIRSACAHLGTFGCDDMSEVTQVAAACQGNVNGQCVESVCSRLGTFGCDDMSEILSVLHECSGNP